MCKTQKHILIVEDDASLRKYFKILLEQSGFNISEASNGVRALSAIAGEKPVDLVLTDLDMPHMTGIELIEEMVKRDFKTPVCVITGIYCVSILSELNQLGCSDILSKPVNSEDLLNKINDILSRKSGTLSLSAC